MAESPGMPTRLLPIDNEESLNFAISLLKSGQPVAFPTDTVYGLGAWLWDSTAIERLFIVKGRQAAKAIAVLVGEQSAVAQVTIGRNAMADRLAERFWPGPLTLVVSGHPSLPANLSPFPTVGVRMPDHPAALALLRRSGPLAVTSANLSDAPNTVAAEDVYAQLAGRIPLILDGGRTPGGRPSTVVDCTGVRPIILRHGPLAETDLLDALLSC